MSAIDASVFRSDVLRKLYDYWLAKRRDGRLPARRDLDPSEITKLLPYVVLIDVEHEPERFRLRLLGTQVCSWAGRDATGKYLDDAGYGDHWQAIAAEYHGVVASRAPHHVVRQAFWAGRDFHTYERLIMPLAGDGVNIDMLLLGLYVLPSGSEA